MQRVVPRYQSSTYMLLLVNRHFTEMDILVYLHALIVRIFLPNYTSIIQPYFFLQYLNGNIYIQAANCENNHLITMVSSRSSSASSTRSSSSRKSYSKALDLSRTMRSSALKERRYIEENIIPGNKSRSDRVQFHAHAKKNIVVNNPLSN